MNDVVNLTIKILNAPNIVTGDNRMSRAAAFVFAFTFLHSLPNALLLLPQGAAAYDESVKDAHKLKLLPVFEIYLAASFLVHGGLAVKSGVPKRRRALLITGVIIAGFLAKHIADFRLGSFRENLPSQQIARVLSRRPDKLIYTLGVLAVALHTYKGISPAWLFRLGFRGSEITRLLALGRVMTGVSTFLYLTPIFVH